MICPSTTHVFEIGIGTTVKKSSGRSVGSQATGRQLQPFQTHETQELAKHFAKLRSGASPKLGLGGATLSEPPTNVRKTLPLSQEIETVLARNGFGDLSTSPRTIRNPKTSAKNEDQPQ